MGKKHVYSSHKHDLVNSCLKFVGNILLLHSNDCNDNNNNNSDNCSYHLLFAYFMLDFVPEALYAVISPQNKYEKENLTKFT